jgi:hypothetical protein
MSIIILRFSVLKCSALVKASEEIRFDTLIKIVKKLPNIHINKLQHIDLFIQLSPVEQSILRYIYKKLPAITITKETNIMEDEHRLQNEENIPPNLTIDQNYIIDQILQDFNNNFDLDSIPTQIHIEQQIDEIICLKDYLRILQSRDEMMHYKELGDILQLLERLRKSSMDLKIPLNSIKSLGILELFDNDNNNNYYYNNIDINNTTQIEFLSLIILGLQDDLQKITNLQNLYEQYKNSQKKIDDQQNQKKELNEELDEQNVISIYDNQNAQQELIIEINKQINLLNTYINDDINDINNASQQKNDFPNVIEIERNFSFKLSQSNKLQNTLHTTDEKIVNNEKNNNTSESDKIELEISPEQKINNEIIFLQSCLDILSPQYSFGNSIKQRLISIDEKNLNVILHFLETVLKSALDIKRNLEHITISLSKDNYYKNLNIFKQFVQNEYSDNNNLIKNNNMQISILTSEISDLKNTKKIQQLFTLYPDLPRDIEKYDNQNKLFKEIENKINELQYQYKNLLKQKLQKNVHSDATNAKFQHIPSDETRAQHNNNISSQQHDKPEMIKQATSIIVNSNQKYGDGTKQAVDYYNKKLEDLEVIFKNLLLQIPQLELEKINVMSMYLCVDNMHLEANKAQNIIQKMKNNLSSQEPNNSLYFVDDPFLLAIKRNLKFQQSSEEFENQELIKILLAISPDLIQYGKLKQQIEDEITTLEKNITDQQKEQIPYWKNELTRLSFSSSNLRTLHYYFSLLETIQFQKLHKAIIDSQDLRGVYYKLKHLITDNQIISQLEQFINLKQLMTQKDLTNLVKNLDNLDINDINFHCENFQERFTKAINIYNKIHQFNNQDQKQTNCIPIKVQDFMDNYYILHNTRQILYKELMKSALCLSCDNRDTKHQFTFGNNVLSDTVNGRLSEGIKMHWNSVANVVYSILSDSFFEKMDELVRNKSDTQIIILDFTENFNQSIKNLKKKHLAWIPGKERDTITTQIFKDMILNISITKNKKNNQKIDILEKKNIDNQTISVNMEINPEKFNIKDQKEQRLILVKSLNIFIDLCFKKYENKIIKISVDIYNQTLKTLCEIASINCDHAVITECLFSYFIDAFATLRIIERIISVNPPSIDGLFTNILQKFWTDFFLHIFLTINIKALKQLLIDPLRLKTFLNNLFSPLVMYLSGFNLNEISDIRNNILNQLSVIAESLFKTHDQDLLYAISRFTIEIPNNLVQNNSEIDNKIKQILAVVVCFNKEHLSKLLSMALSLTDQTCGVWQTSMLYNSSQYNRILYSIQDGFEYLFEKTLHVIDNNFVNVKNLLILITQYIELLKNCNSIVFEIFKQYIKNDLSENEIVRYFSYYSKIVEDIEIKIKLNSSPMKILTIIYNMEQQFKHLLLKYSNMNNIKKSHKCNIQRILQSIMNDFNHIKQDLYSHILNRKTEEEKEEELIKKGIQSSHTTTDAQRELFLDRDTTEVDLLGPYFREFVRCLSEINIENTNSNPLSVQSKPATQYYSEASHTTTSNMSGLTSERHHDSQSIQNQFNPLTLDNQHSQSLSEISEKNLSLEVSSIFPSISLRDANRGAKQSKNLLNDQILNTIYRAFFNYQNVNIEEIQQLEQRQNESRMQIANNQHSMYYEMLLSDIAKFENHQDFSKLKQRIDIIDDDMKIKKCITNNMIVFLYHVSNTMKNMQFNNNQKQVIYQKMTNISLRLSDSIVKIKNIMLNCIEQPIQQEGDSIDTMYIKLIYYNTYFVIKCILQNGNFNILKKWKNNLIGIIEAIEIVTTNFASSLLLYNMCLNKMCVITEIDNAHLSFLELGKRHLFCPIVYKYILSIETYLQFIEQTNSTTNTETNKKNLQQSIEYCKQIMQNIDSALIQEVDNNQ